MVVHLCGRDDSPGGPRYAVAAPKPASAPGLDDEYHGKGKLICEALWDSRERRFSAVLQSTRGRVGERAPWTVYRLREPPGLDRSLPGAALSANGAASVHPG